MSEIERRIKLNFLVTIQEYQKFKKLCVDNELTMSDQLRVLLDNFLKGITTP